MSVEFLIFLQSVLEYHIASLEQYHELIQHSYIISDNYTLQHFLNRITETEQLIERVKQDIYEKIIELILAGRP